MAHFVHGFTRHFAGAFATLFDDGADQIRLFGVFPAALLHRFQFGQYGLDHRLFALDTSDSGRAATLLDPVPGVLVRIDFMELPHRADFRVAGVLVRAAGRGEGRASLALVTAAIASFVGGTVANVFFTLFAPLLATVALSFGPPEIFALMLLAFATFVGLGGDDIPKTIFSICFGLVLATVGFDTISGEPRLVLFGFIVLAIGVYGIGEMLWTIEQTRGEITTTNPKMSVKGMVADTKEATRRGWRGTMIGSFLGFFVGVLPAAGATPGSLMSYGVAKMIAKNPKEYGTGTPDGVAAPEAANNSASTGAMLPMLTLGIPGSPTTAILLGGMVIWGLTPGPRLFVDESEFVWGLIGSFYVSNVAALLINLAFIPLFVWMLRMPFTILAPLIFVLSIIGGFAAARSMHDIWLIVIFGIGAFFMRKFDYPLAPAVLAIVLGPIAEPTLRQSLLLSSGDPSIFFTRPIAAPIMVIAIILIVLPGLKLLRGKQKDVEA